MVTQHHRQFWSKQHLRYPHQCLQLLSLFPPLPLQLLQLLQRLSGDKFIRTDSKEVKVKVVSKWQWNL